LADNIVAFADNINVQTPPAPRLFLQGIWFSRQQPPSRPLAEGYDPVSLDTFETLLGMIRPIDQHVVQRRLIP
jgi:hypothetical protein